MGIVGEEANWRMFGLAQTRRPAGCKHWEHYCGGGSRKAADLVGLERVCVWCFTESHHEGTELVARFPLTHLWVLVAVAGLPICGGTRQ